MRLRNFILFFPAAVALAGLSGCFIDSGSFAHTGELQTQNISVPPGAAKSVRAHLQMGAGELAISGGSSRLLDGTIEYNVPEWKPDMTYSVSDGEGSLRLAQPESSHSAMGGVKYNWNLHFNNAIPLDLTIEMGAGDSNLNFSGMILRSLDVKMGAGESRIDFTGNWKQNLNATLQAGVGEAHLKLPREVGVRVSVQGGLGEVDAPDFKRDGSDYVNDAYGKSPVTLDIRIAGGIGEVHLELAGSRGIV
ncbi:MAG TPA: toast rack family protein [Candidatus Acidoferrales bacterium]|nr:toast rack family protein [Candidatus Acidoferrales bacterium]